MCQRVRRRRRGQSGQTLFIVILVLVVVALVGALFARVIINSQLGVNRAESTSTLYNIAEAGVRFADFQLTYSADGADWRPEKVAAGDEYSKTYEFGNAGSFMLKVSYNPAAISLTNQQARGIKIESVATVKDNPFLKRSLSVVKLLTLTDYLRFVAGSNTASQVAYFGAPNIIQGVELDGVTKHMVGYQTVFNGPVHVNGETLWVGTSGTPASNVAIRMYLQDADVGALDPPRADTVETAGYFHAYDAAVPGTVLASQPIFQSTVDGSVITSGFIGKDVIGSSVLVDLGLNDRLVRYSDYSHKPDYNNIARAARRLPAPAVNAPNPATGQLRYLMLTRDSGDWRQVSIQDPNGVSNTYHFLGEFGIGKGIYVDNVTEVQYNHDLATLRTHWLTPSAGLHGWDKAGWGYTPSCVDAAGAKQYPITEVIFHPDNASAETTAAGQTPWPAGTPVIEIRRYDGLGWPRWNSTLARWERKAGTSGTVETIFLPYPTNGILNFGGSVRVSGVLPPAQPNAVTVQRYNNRTVAYDFTNPALASNDDSAGGNERFYDITLVSAGTIYIEGDIMSPQTYVANGGTITGYTPGAANDLDPNTGRPGVRNSRVALLASDSVCLNMTAVTGRLDDSDTATTGTWTALGGYWTLTNGQKATWTYRTHQPQSATAPQAQYLYIRHAGVGPTWTDGVGNPTYSQAKLTLGGANIDWSPGQGATFSFNPTSAAGLISSNRDMLSIVPSLQWEVSVRPLFSLVMDGSLNTVALTSTSASNSYAIAGLGILPPRVNIDALVYAQQGSWTILPGPWFNQTWNYPGNLIAGDPVDDTLAAAGVPSYLLSLGAIPLTDGNDQLPMRPRIFFNGAIAENFTSIPEDVQLATSKWCGPVPSGGTTAHALISYDFDAGLRQSVYGDGNGYALARLPKLPCPPGLLVWQEQ